MSEARGEYVPAPCTHRPSKHPSEVRMRPHHCGRIWASQGGLSRNKVAVGESAAGSPPNDRDSPLWGEPTFHTHRSLCSFLIPEKRYFRPTRAIGHRRTTKANKTTWSARRPSWAHSSAAECLLCKEDAVGSNPTESMSARTRIVRLIRVRRFECDTTKINAPSRESGLGRIEQPSTTTLGRYEIVCTCNPGVH